MCYRAAVIHISDTEFGPNNRATQEVVREQHGDACKVLMDAFISDIRKVVIGEHSIMASQMGLIISGDITNKGADAEFSDAAKNVEYVLKELGIPFDQLAIVPGNHDVNWSECKKAYEYEVERGKGRTEEELREQIRRSPKKLAGFAKFFRRMCRQEFRLQIPMRFHGFQKLGVALIGFDTTYPSLWSPEDNYGVLQAEQVRAAKTILQAQLEASSKLIPIAVMHHSLLPFPAAAKDTSLLHQSEEVTRWLREDAKFRIVLCGHEHTPRRSASIGTSFNILVTGSFGLSLEELMKGYREGRRPETNKYEIILIRPEGQMKFLYRRLDREAGLYSTGIWESDKSGGQSFAKITLGNIGTREAQPKQSSIGLVAGKPVKLQVQENCKNWLIAVKLKQQALTHHKIRSVRYRVEPGGDYVDGDPCSDFLACLSTEELEARSIKAHIALESGNNINKDMRIPSQYEPCAHDLSFNRLK